MFTEVMAKFSKNAFIEEWPEKGKRNGLRDVR